MAKSNRAGGGPRPGQDEIARRAYELFLQRGSVPGHETDDWLQAEAELAAGGGETERAESQAPKPEQRRPAESATRRREPGAAGGRRTLRQ
ncbi:MAG TPA: DUF2934 domain-containing protein [Polyangia bacterium]|jgi:hypothetical protein|nr:DUF2934 domain-containing protein [Polyangia bacterium]